MDIDAPSSFGSQRHIANKIPCLAKSTDQRRAPAAHVNMHRSLRRQLQLAAIARPQRHHPAAVRRQRRPHPTRPGLIVRERDLRRSVAKQPRHEHRLRADLPLLPADRQRSTESTRQPDALTTVDRQRLRRRRARRAALRLAEAADPRHLARARHLTVAILVHRRPAIFHPRRHLARARPPPPVLVAHPRRRPAAPHLQRRRRPLVRAHLDAPRRTAPDLLHALGAGLLRRRPDRRQRALSTRHPLAHLASALPHLRAALRIERRRRQAARGEHEHERGEGKGEGNAAPGHGPGFAPPTRTVAARRHFFLAALRPGRLPRPQADPDKLRR